jgi:hypothetical protein
MNVDDITESQLGTGHECSKESETTTTVAAALAAIDLGLLEDMDIDEETPGMVHPAFTMSDFHAVVMTTTSAFNALSSIDMDALVDSDSEDTTGLPANVASAALAVLHPADPEDNKHALIVANPTVMALAAVDLIDTNDSDTEDPPSTAENAATAALATLDPTDLEDSDAAAAAALAIIDPADLVDDDMEDGEPTATPVSLKVGTGHAATVLAAIDVDALVDSDEEEFPCAEETASAAAVLTITDPADLVDDHPTTSPVSLAVETNNAASVLAAINVDALRDSDVEGSPAVKEHATTISATVDLTDLKDNDAPAPFNTPAPSDSGAESNRHGHGQLPHVQSAAAVALAEITIDALENGGFEGEFNSETAISSATTFSVALAASNVSALDACDFLSTAADTPSLARISHALSLARLMVETKVLDNMEWEAQPQFTSNNSQITAKNALASIGLGDLDDTDSGDDMEESDSDVQSGKMNSTTDFDSTLLRTLSSIDRLDPDLWNGLMTFVAARDASSSEARSMEVSLPNVLVPTNCDIHCFREQMMSTGP